MAMAIALAAIWVLYTSAPYGIGITPDSVHYLSADQNLASTGSLYTYTGKPLVSWAPMMPSLYAVGYLIGMRGEAFALLINIGAFGGIIIVCSLWLRALINIWQFPVALAAVLLSKPVLHCAMFAWSELLFIASVRGSLWSVWLYVRSGKTSHLAAASILGALCLLIRYIGTSVAFCATFFLLLYPYKPLQRRFTESAVYLLITNLPLGMWLVRNKAISGTLMGLREHSDYAWRDILWDTFNIWHSWFVPVDFAKSRTLLLLMLGGVGVVVALLIVRYWREAPSACHSAMLVLGLFVISCSLVLMWSAAAVRFEDLGTRLWAPVSIPLVLLSRFILVSLRHLHRYFILTTLVLVVCLIVGWTLSGATYAIRTLRDIRPKGIPSSINSPKRQAPETLHYLRHRRLSGVVYSNEVPEIFYWTGFVARWLPFRRVLRVAWEDGLVRWNQFVGQLHDAWSQGQKAYVVWFNSNKREYLYKPEELQKHLDAEPVAGFADGRVFVLKPRIK